MIPLSERLSAQTPTNEIIIREIAGKVEVSRVGAQTRDPAYTNQVLHAGDQIHTYERSRVALRWSDQSIVRIGELADLQIQPATVTKARSGFNLLKGALLYFLSRDKPSDLLFNTRHRFRGHSRHGIQSGDERGWPNYSLTVLDGEVELSNDQGRTNLLSREQGIAEPKTPTKTAVINTINVIQWALIPAFWTLMNSRLSAAEEQALAESVAAYRKGDLLEALAKYPADRQPASATERFILEHCFWLLDKSKKTVLLNSPDISALLMAASGSGRRSRKLIDAVTLQPHPAILNAQLSTNLATAWLAESYYQQSRRDLTNALRAARSATTNSPRFAFGWARVAELEFSFGRTSEALTALNKSLELASRNEEALALRGFLLSAQNKISAAITNFESAIAIDGALGNAWLGRGLCRIRQGKAEAGREDLLMAAALEPQRALLRSSWAIFQQRRRQSSGDKELNWRKAG
jgi:tetratricopeptide (TPR) repeat protein